MSRTSRNALLAGVLLSCAVVADTPYDGVGRLASNSEIRARSISVASDGTGLPPGRGSAIQGRALYEAQCTLCHGARGEGVGVYPPIAGGTGTLTTDEPLRTVGSFWPYATTVWDYINRSMPYQSPGTLSTDEVYAITAYVLFLNGIVRKQETLDARTLPRVRMPNRDGFKDDPRPDAGAVTAQCKDGGVH